MLSVIPVRRLLCASEFKKTLGHSSQIGCYNHALHTFAVVIFDYSCNFNVMFTVVISWPWDLTIFTFKSLHEIRLYLNFYLVISRYLKRLNSILYVSFESPKSLNAKSERHEKLGSVALTKNSGIFNGHSMQSVSHLRLAVLVICGLCYKNMLCWSKELFSTVSEWDLVHLVACPFVFKARHMTWHVWSSWTCKTL